MTTTPPLLTLRDVRCVLEGQTVLDGIDLDVQRGERVALIGPNGAGKTTLFQAICGLRPLQAGSISLAGQRLDRLRPDQIARAGVGRSFQTPQVYASLSVADNLRGTLLGQRRGGWLRRLGGDTALEHGTARWLQAMQLQLQASTPARHLDDASLRALELGMALATEAQLLLLDEPTAGMSRTQAVQLLDRVAQCCAGRTLLLIEHDLDAVFRLASRVVVLHHGRVLADGTPQQVRADPRVQTAYMGAAP